MITLSKQRDRPLKDVAGPTWLQALFPAPPAPADTPAGGSRAGTANRRIRAVVVYTAVLAAGVVVMLARIPGRPAWDTIYNEDLTVYLVDALARPWHLFTVYGGYIQLMPRLLGQLAASLPLRWAAKVFALSGALSAAASAILVFQASAGHIRSVALRALAGASVLLVPVATLEIADSGVGSPWCLLLALFWATMWRPRTRRGMAAAAVTGFLTSSALPLTLVFAPVLAARLIVLRRLRDHAVTIGWAAGLLVQVPAIIYAQVTHQSRLARRVPIGHALAFYGHAVVQSALGWHVGWWLQSAVGHDGAAAIVGAVLAVFFAWALIACPYPTRLLIVIALLTGFVFAVVSADLGYRFAQIGLGVTVQREGGSRYAMLGIFLIDCAAIAAVDALIQRHRASRQSDQPDLGSLVPRMRGLSRQVAPVLAVLALVAVLSVGWVTDYRFWTMRSLGWAATWSTVLGNWERTCARNPAGAVRTGAWDLPVKVTEAMPCTRIRP